MLRKEIKVNCITSENNEWATYLVQTANNYASSVRLQYKDYDMNAKSLLGILSLAISNGAVVTVAADGSDEDAAVEAVSNILMKKE